MVFEEDRTQATCPYCGNTFGYSQNEMQEGGIVSCRGCGSIIETRRRPSFQQTEQTTTQDPIFGRQSGPTRDPVFSGPETGKKSGISGNSVACIIIAILLFVPLIIAIPLAACIGLWYMTKNKD